MESISTRERIEAQLILAIQEQPSSAVIPSLEDIELWHHGKLSDSRAQEIEDCVANDSRCYQLWRQLRYEESSKPSVQTRRSSAILGGVWNWVTNPLPSNFGTGWGSGIAVASILLVAIVLMPKILINKGIGESIDDSYLQWKRLGTAPANSWPTYAPSDIKTFDLNQLIRQNSRDYDIRVFRHGMRRGLETLVSDSAEWSKVLTDLDDGKLVCPADLNYQKCSEKTQTLMNLGRWAVLAYFACAEDKILAQETDIKGRLTNSLIAQDASGEFAVFMKNWSRSGKNDSGNYCSNVVALIEHGK